MEIFIYTLEGQPLVVNLDEVGACYPADDVIYFCGIPCRLSSATPNTACTRQETGDAESDSLSKPAVSSGLRQPLGGFARK